MLLSVVTTSWSSHEDVGSSLRNPRIPIHRICLQTTFPARMSILHCRLTIGDFGVWLEGRSNIRELYGPQTKILEGRANIRERIFKALFTYVSTRLGRRSFEKCFENTFPICSPNEDFGSPNEHLGAHFRSTFLRNVAQIEYSPL